MAEAAHRISTYQDVLEAPEGFTAEIIAGELHLTPRPAVPHAYSASNAGADLNTTFGRRESGGDRPGGWWIIDEPELHLGRSDPRSEVLVPDLAGWRRSRMPKPPRAAAVELAPDWVCEVLSPGSRNVRRDRLLKADAYHLAGVAHYWLIDPLARLVEVFEHAEVGWTRTHAVSGDEPARLPPFDAVALQLSEWWLPEDEEDAQG